MTLARQMLLMTVIFLSLLGVIAIVSFNGYLSAVGDVDTALEGIERLGNSVEEAASLIDQSERLTAAGLHLAVARTFLATQGYQGNRILGELAKAKSDLGDVEDDTHSDDSFTLQDFRQRIDKVTQQIEQARQLAPHADQQRAVSALAEIESMLAAWRSNLLSRAEKARQLAKDEREQAVALRDELDKRRWAAASTYGLLGTTLIVLTIALAIQQYRTVMAPLRRLQAGAQRLGAGDFDQPVPELRPAEFGEVAREFNAMSSRLATLYRELEDRVRSQSTELARSERLASVGYLAAGVAHEINNPLGIIAGYAELAMRKLDKNKPQTPADREQAEALRETLQTIHEETFRCKDIIGRLLTLARQRNETNETVDVVRIVAGVVEMVQSTKSTGQRIIGYRVEPGTANEQGQVNARIGQDELKQVLLNLVMNAVDFTDPTTGQITLTISQFDDVVSIEVKDNGRGMAEETLSRIFEPFYTAHRSGDNRGTGLGLSISHAIVEGAGGELTATSTGIDKGSQFVVTLPAEYENPPTR